jgi:hypothetical protein
VEQAFKKPLLKHGTQNNLQQGSTERIDRKNRKRGILQHKQCISVFVCSSVEEGCRIDLVNESRQREIMKAWTSGQRVCLVAEGLVLSLAFGNRLLQLEVGCC